MSAWLVKWKLIGEPATIPLKMLLEVPEEAFPFCRLADEMDTFNIDTTAFFALASKQTVIFMWNRKEEKYRVTLVRHGYTTPDDNVAHSPKYINLEDARKWLRQQLQ